MAATITRAYLDGIQDNLLDFCDQTRLTGQTRAGHRALSREVPPELRPGLAPELNGVPATRNSGQIVGPSCRLTEVVHPVGSGRVRGRESERGPLTLSPEAGGSTPDHSAKPLQFSSL